MVLVFILGLLIGSFLNVLIDRLPEQQDVIKGRSHCDFCKRILHWYELIPVCSWISQCGKSRCCGKRLSVQYPLVELFTGFGYVFIASNFPSFYPLFSLIFALVIFSALLVIFVVDLKNEIIPMEMIYVGLTSAVILLISPHISCVTGNLLSCTPFIIPRLLSALVSAFFFLALWFFSKGKSMGDGDIFLAFLIGFLSGFPLVLVTFYVAFLTGAMVGVILILGRKKTMKSHIPFGPFMIFGLAFALLYGGRIVEWLGML